MKLKKALLIKHFKQFGGTKDAFYATDNNMELQGLLKVFGVTELYIGGLKVFILTDAIKEMLASGAKTMTYDLI